MLYFAYGSNMSRAVMARHCPRARPLGVAALSGWQYCIMPGGYGSVRPRRGSMVHGVLWRLMPGDLAALDAYEEVARGLYMRRRVNVQHGARRIGALTYVGRRAGDAKPLPGYQEDVVIPAAEHWQLPASYIRELRRWRAAE
jgi:gamma-glutamylcyclotransferase (GGCT)/AIG2-like uncharacterized protein YtfP